MHKVCVVWQYVCGIWCVYAWCICMLCVECEGVCCGGCVYGLCWWSVHSACDVCGVPGMYVICVDMYNTCAINVWGPPSPRIYLWSIVCLFLVFKLQSPAKYSPFDSVHLSRLFFHCSKWYLNSSISMLFSASAIFFCFTSSTLANCFHLRMFFHLGKQEKVTWGEVRWIGSVGQGGHALFGEHSAQRGQMYLSITHHAMGKRVEWVFKKFHWSWT